MDGFDNQTFLAGGRLIRFKATGLTPFAAVAAVTSAEQSLLTGGWQAGDIVVKLQKPTKQAGLAVTGARIDASGNLLVEFTNPTAGAITPTTTEIYDMIVLR